MGLLKVYVHTGRVQELWNGGRGMGTVVRRNRQAAMHMHPSNEASATVYRDDLAGDVVALFGQEPH